MCDRKLPHKLKSTVILPVLEAWSGALGLEEKITRSSAKSCEDDQC